jgi:RHS repeat-associated protein
MPTQQAEDIYYYPYGEIKTNTGPVNVRFKYTGKEFDAEDGLYYYGARYYDPKLTRFISSDTIVPQPFYPQSLNRYAYAYNNPIVLRDLDGHYAPDPGFDMDFDWSWTDDWDWGSGGGSDYNWSDWGSGSSVGGGYYYDEYDYSLSTINYNGPVSSPRVLTFSNSYTNTASSFYMVDEIGDYTMYAANTYGNGTAYDFKSAGNSTIEYAPSSSGTLSNPLTRQAVLDVGDELNADRILVIGADRPREIQDQLIQSKATKTEYAQSQHGAVQGYRAADVRYYRSGNQIDPLTVAHTAQTIPSIGGIGVYRTFTHIDIRPRKSDGGVYKWGW